MAGGPSTPALAAAVSGAGGLGFLAAGMLMAPAVADQIEAVRRLTASPFGVNVFMPSRSPGDPAEIADYMRQLQPIADQSGVTLGEAVWNDDDFAHKIELLLDPEWTPAVVSFAFGCPEPELVRRLQEVGAQVWVTVTQVDEAEQAHASGADGVIAQGAEAGGHRGSFSDDDREPIPVLELVDAIRRALPGDGVQLIAAGAIMDGADVAGALAHGADAVQLGSAFMLTPEAGTNAVHRAALSRPGATALTRAFSGRRARGIVNGWMERVGDTAPSAYPAVNAMAGPLRKHGVAVGDPNLVNLWAGTRHDEARERPAADLVAELVGELEAARAG